MKMAPVEVSALNQEQVWQTVYAPYNLYKNRQTLEGCDRVRIEQVRQNFWKKGYMLAWIEELFTVIRIINTQPIIYVLKVDAAKNYKVFFITKIYRKSVINYCIVLRPFYKNAAVLVDEKSI